MTAADGTVMEGEFLACEGIGSQPVAGFATADIDRPEDAAEGGMRGYGELRPGGWDPRQRQGDQDVDGVVFEVLYPSMAMAMFRIPDVELQQAVFKAYNSWVADYVAVAPDRFLGIAMIGLDDMDWALKELDRAHTLGLRGAMIWDDPGDKTYADLYFDPFWRAAAERNMPVSLHILTGKHGVGVEDFAHPHYLAEYLWLTHPIQRSMSLMLVSGVFERHPNLKLVSVENDIGWLPHYLQRLEHVYTEVAFLQRLRTAPVAAGVLRAQLLCHLSGRPGGRLQSRCHRGRSGDVGLGLPACRLHPGPTAARPSSETSRGFRPSRYVPSPGTTWRRSTGLASRRSTLIRHLADGRRGTGDARTARAHGHLNR